MTMNPLTNTTSVNFPKGEETLQEDNKKQIMDPSTWLHSCLQSTLTELGYRDLLSKFVDCGVGLDEWINSDKVLIDKWLTELGMVKIGARSKFVKLMSDAKDDKIKARCSITPSDKIYLVEYDKEVKFNATVGWPHPDVYRSIIENADSEEAMEDIQETNGTIGVVVSLLLTMVFLQNGRDVTVSTDSMWGENSSRGQDLLTCFLVLTAVICVCVILFTTRVYFAALLLPKDSGRLAMAVIGGDFALNYALCAFFTFAMAFGGTIAVWITLVLDKGTASFMLMLSCAMLVIQLAMCGFNQWWPGGTVDMRFEQALAIIFPHVANKLDTKKH